MVGRAGLLARLSPLALAATIGAVLLFAFAPLLFGDVVISRDVGRLYFAVHQYIAERVRAGELPLWYPYEALGVPFIGAAVTAVFHPLSWLSVIFGPVRGMWLGHLLAVVVATAGAFVLARRIGAGRAGAAIAGFSFGAGGAVVSMLDLQTYLFGPVAFPWLLLGAFAAVSACRPSESSEGRDSEPGTRGPWPPRTSLPWICLGASALAWMVLAGDMQGAMVMGTAALLIGLAVAEPGSRFRALFIVAIIGVLGAALSAIQLLPSIEIASELDRTAGMEWHRAREWSLHPWRLTEIALPHQPLLEGGSPARSWLYPDREEPWHRSLYLGVTLVTGLIFAASKVDRANRRGRVIFALFLLSGLFLWLALGRWAGLYRLAFELIPLWNGFRYPEKLFSHAALPLALLAGLGIDSALRSPRSGSLIGASVAVSLLILAGVSWVIAGSVSLEETTHSYFRHLGLGLARGALITGALSLVLLLAWRAKERAGMIAALLLPTLAIFDLAGPTGVVVHQTTADALALEAPSMVSDWLRAEKKVEATGGARITTLAGRGLGVVLSPELSRESSGTLENFLWSRHALEAGHAAAMGIESTTHYLPALSRRHRELQMELYSGWLREGAHLFSGRYLVVNAAQFDPALFPEHQLPADFSDYGILVLEQPAALPRAFVAAPLFVSSSEEARASLVHAAVMSGQVASVEASKPGWWPQTDGEKNALGASRGPVEEASTSVDGGPRAAPPVSSGEARITRHSPEAVQVEVLLSRPALLVLNDAWWPGWRVWVDGVRTEPLRVNYLVRGVLLPAGEHEVVFGYPASLGLMLGAAFSLMALLAAASLLFLGLRGRSRRCRKASPWMV